MRDWLHVEDHARAIWAVLERGRPGEVYNIGGHAEMTNREVAEHVLDLAGAPRSLIRPVADRPGHDRRYAMNPSKIERELGWAPGWHFADGLAATVAWYRAHEDWWRAVKSGAYRDYYERQYGSRLS